MREKYIFIVAGGVAIIIGTVLALSGFGANPSSPATATHDASVIPATEVPFTKVIGGKKSQISVRANFLITSKDQVKELWKLIDATTTPPRVDFTTHAIIAVFAGAEPSASIAVAKIEDTDKRTVSVEIAKPKPEEICVKKALTTSPYEIVIVSTTSLPFTHQDIPTVICPS